MFYLMTYLAHFIYGYQTYGKGPLREETYCHHMGYSFQLAARVLLYASLSVSLIKKSFILTTYQTDACTTWTGCTLWDDFI